jgi:hypothetical protein
MTLTAFRLIGIGLSGLTALIAGLSLTGLPSASNPTSSNRPLSTFSSPDQADVRDYVVRLGRTGFFPAATPLDTEAASANLADAAAQASQVSAQNAAASPPMIHALVLREAQWRLYANGEEALISVFSPGEELFDGWRITEITPRTLHLERDGQSQTIDVFRPVQEG